MTDRELLELAAKAAGIELFYDIFYDEEPCYHEKEIDCNIVWNPLTDDGDALRLAVKGNLNIELQEYCVYATGIETMNGQLFEWHAGDRCRATRYAIVYAAAEIGKSL